MLLCETASREGLAANATTLAMARRYRDQAAGKAAALKAALERHTDRYGAGAAYDTKAVIARKERLEYFNDLYCDWADTVGEINDAF